MHAAARKQNLAMAAAIASKRLTKGCFHRLAGLSSISAALHAPPFPPQASVGSTGSYQPVENVRKICAQSVCYRGLADARELFDSKHGCRRWYAGSNSEKAKPDADLIATEMIKYATTCRNLGKLTNLFIMVN